MPILERTSFIDASIVRVFAFFSDPQNLAKITPPSLGFQIVEAPQRRLQEGDRIVYRIRVNGVPVRWVTHITSWEEGKSFSDFQEKGPYRLWHHLHTFESKNGGVEMKDRVEYELPFGFLGAFFGGWFVRRQLKRIFDFREQTIRATFGS